MTDLICKNTMRQCQTPGMCSPFGGCREVEPVSSVWLEQLRTEFRASVRECERLQAENETLRAEAKRLEEANAGMQKDVVQHRRRKSQYFRAVRWFMAHTNLDPKDIPGQVYHTLMHVVQVLAKKAQRQSEEVKPRATPSGTTRSPSARPSSKA